MGGGGNNRHRIWQFILIIFKIYFGNYHNLLQAMRHQDFLYSDDHAVAVAVAVAVQWQPVAVAFCLETEGVDLVIVLSSKHSKRKGGWGLTMHGIKE